MKKTFLIVCISLLGVLILAFGVTYNNNSAVDTESMDRSDPQDQQEKEIINENDIVTDSTDSAIQQETNAMDGNIYPRDIPEQ